MLTALLLVAAYLCSSLPTGKWLALRAGVDVRRAGNGNVGATNVARTAGALAGLLTLIADIVKGFIPTLLMDYTPGDRWPVTAGIIIARHRQNITRLRQKHEPKFRLTRPS